MGPAFSRRDRAAAGAEETSLARCRLVLRSAGAAVSAAGNPVDRRTRNDWRRL